MMDKERVVITGMGAVTPFGVGIAPFAKALQNGESGIRLLRAFDTADYPVKGGGEVPGDLPAVAGLADHAPRYLHYAALAAKEAWKSAGLLTEEPLAEEAVAHTGFVYGEPPCPPERIGVLLGTSRGAVRELEMLCDARQAGRTLSPELLAALFPAFGHCPLGSGIARLLGAAGPVGTISAACASGTVAIGEAAAWIRSGRCDLVVAGGAEAPFTPTSFAGVCSSKAMSERWDDPAAACRPFDRDRDGYVMGEGAGVVVLESLASAKRRGAAVLAEIAGYAQTADASHITVPSGEGMRVAIRSALSEAGLSPADLDYINAHGTSTPLNDRWETWAIRAALGPHADRVPVSSTKSMTGHLLGAAGAVEAIACLLALQDQFLPPTINYRTPDPDCNLDVVPNTARRAALHHVMSQSLGFGGHNAALVLSLR
ncbi:beta-ketoacyl-[acyl-carrier-protein] synthase family protein [Tumebacillus sp. DT12]|uniref:Beta-ketoacyl-[acyl-carrier-protein] synthase family protein n=1 Tax=Tumebacillus lacus TaxID=2995335 RepID=A0ABT3WXX0_9BACL|nr:beta-ketoacyl-[acyl-carrier-protein] synthase family protein [Tumebacillus lacus]MCX7569476.1 beta-ketoacyl-[acyl-carrier-protein] synthase family protein [Tumebacillus lacus]